MPEALERLRFAACLEDKSEFYANAYANVLRAQGQLSEAVQFLTVREEILGSRSSQPARTLFLTLRDAGRLTEAFAVLEKALARRTDDHDLMLFATLEYARVGRFKEAEVLLERARGQVAENAYLHYAGALASYQGERKNEAQFAEMLIARDPLNIGAHHSYARSLMASDGIQAVDAHFEQAVARFPHHLGLRQAHIEWLRDEGDLKRIAEVIDAYVTLRPTDAWGRRERALLLRRRGQHTTALTESEEACRLEPYNGICHAIRGQLLRDLGKYVEAQKAYGLAIQLDVDQTYALSGLLACTQDRNEKRKMLRWVEQQLSTQPFVGEAFVTFAALADGPYTSEERQASLQRLLQARPDVWQTWSALIDHLRERGQFDEALKGALSAVERFPLTANLRLDLAEVQQARGEDEAAIATLRETLTLHPSWGSAVHRLCYLLERLNRVDEARQVLEQARERTPLDNSLTVAHAELLYRHGERETALSLLKHAVESDPNSDDLWEQFKAWASALGKNETVLATMRGLLAAQPENAHLHVAAARALPGSGLEERLKLIDKALELAPRWVAAHDFKAQILAEAGQFDAAVAACRPSVLTPQPLSLRARAAWIEGVREAFDKAIPQMKAVVNEDASYLWAWQILAGWHYDREEAQPLGEAARQLTRLNPESPQGWGYLAQARLWQNDRAGAKAALNEALRYAPGVSYIGNMLLSLQIEDDELPAAEETLTRLTPALLRTAGIQRMALQLAVKQGNQTKALTHFDSLCEDAIRADEHYQVSRAIHDLTHATWREQALERLHTLLRAPGIPSTLGSQWARGMWICAKGDLALSMLPRLAGGTPAERHAAAQSIANCAEDGETERPRNFLRQYAPMLRQPDSAWGTVAHALTVLSDWTGVVEWTADWQQRTEVEPWMLLNRAEGFWFLGHNDDARAINRHAFNLPADYTHAWHALYLAFDASLRGEDPGPWIADYELDPERLPPNLVYMLLLVHAYARARKQKDFSAAKQLVAQAKTVWTDAPRFPGSKRWAGQIANRIAEAIGGAPAWLWAKTAG
jgi:tetratricopeptide (TPR) repeat protein